MTEYVVIGYFQYARKSDQRAMFCVYVGSKDAKTVGTRVDTIFVACDTVENGALKPGAKVNVNVDLKGYVTGVKVIG